MTVTQVARRAGVSAATVSRAFNSPDLVARATLARVRESARALGFVPNASARTLRTQRSRILGVVLPTLRNPVFAECLEGIAARARDAGYAIVPLFTDYTPARERDAIAHLLARDVDGVILTVASAARSASLARLREARLPYVLAYNRHPAQPCVSVDGEQACAQATGRLLALGHRRIAMVSGTLAASDRARQRHRGFARAMAAAGTGRAELIEVPFLQDATQALAARLARADRPTALLCSNDLLALRSLRAAAEIVVNNQLERHLCAQAPNVERTSALVDEALARNIPLDGELLGYTLHQTLVRLASAWVERPDELGALERLAGLSKLARALPFEVSMWEVQNACWEVREQAFHVKHSTDAAWHEASVTLCAAARIAGA
jgi:DNA-binding LacI/PurR family transcriptional regulator